MNTHYEENVYSLTRRMLRATPANRVRRSYLLLAWYRRARERGKVHYVAAILRRVLEAMITYYGELPRNRPFMDLEAFENKDMLYGLMVLVHKIYLTLTRLTEALNEADWRKKWREYIAARQDAFRGIRNLDQLDDANLNKLLYTHFVGETYRFATMTRNEKLAYIHSEMYHLTPAKLDGYLTAMVELAELLEVTVLFYMPDYMLGIRETRVDRALARYTKLYAENTIIKRIIYDLRWYLKEVMSVLYHSPGLEDVNRVRYARMMAERARSVPQPAPAITNPYTRVRRYPTITIPPSAVPPVPRVPVSYYSSTVRTPHWLPVTRKNDQQFLVPFYPLALKPGPPNTAGLTTSSTTRTNTGTTTTTTTALPSIVDYFVDILLNSASGLALPLDIIRRELSKLSTDDFVQVYRRTTLGQVHRLLPVLIGILNAEWQARKYSVPSGIPRTWHAATTGPNASAFLEDRTPVEQGPPALPASPTFSLVHYLYRLLTDPSGPLYLPDELIQQQLRELAGPAFEELYALVIPQTGPHIPIRAYYMLVAERYRRATAGLGRAVALSPYAVLLDNRPVTAPSSRSNSRYIGAVFDPNTPQAKSTGLLIASWDQPGTYTSNWQIAAFFRSRSDLEFEALDALLHKYKEYPVSDRVWHLFIAEYTRRTERYARRVNGSLQSSTATSSNSSSGNASGVLFLPNNEEPGDWPLTAGHSRMRRQRPPVASPAIDDSAELVNALPSFATQSGSLLHRPLPPASITVVHLDRPIPVHIPRSVNPSTTTLVVLEPPPAAWTPPTLAPGIP